MDLVLCLCQELKLELCESEFRRWLSCRNIYFMLESSRKSAVWSLTRRGGGLVGKLLTRPPYC